jgi:hypothetical protein
VLAQGRNGRHGGFLGRIEERNITAQDQVTFVCFGVGRFALQIAIGNGQDAKAIRRQEPVFFAQVLDEDGFHGQHFAVVLEVRAALEDLFRGAFADEVPSGVSTITDISRRTKSKGISSSLRWACTLNWSWISSLWASTARSRTFLSPV